jgi:hypothetical protein
LLKGRSDFAVQAGADLASQLAEYSRSFSVASPERLDSPWYELASIEKLREFLRHNNQRLMPRIEPGNASAPTEPVIALH